MCIRDRVKTEELDKTSNSMIFIERDCALSSEEINNRLNTVSYTHLDVYKRQILTGGLSHSDYFTQILSKKIGKHVEMTENGRYAGALGASFLAEEKKKR